MIKLKVTEEYRVETENEAKNAMETLRAKQLEEGYNLTQCSYTYKEKRAKGEVVDRGYLVKAVKVYGGFWE